jgi:hypothetical protein
MTTIYHQHLQKVRSHFHGMVFSHYDVHSYSTFGGDDRWAEDHAADWGTESLVSILKTHCMLGFVSHFISPGH